MREQNQVAKVANVVARVADNVHLAGVNVGNCRVAVCAKEKTNQQSVSDSYKKKDAEGKDNVEHTRVTKRYYGADFFHGRSSQVGRGEMDHLGALRVSAHDNLRVWALAKSLRDKRSPEMKMTS